MLAVLALELEVQSRGVPKRPHGYFSHLALIALPAVHRGRNSSVTPKQDLLSSFFVVYIRPRSSRPLNTACTYVTAQQHSISGTISYIFVDYKLSPPAQKDKNINVHS